MVQAGTIATEWTWRESSEVARTTPPRLGWAMAVPGVGRTSEGHGILSPVPVPVPPACRIDRRRRKALLRSSIAGDGVGLLGGADGAERGCALLLVAL